MKALIKEIRNESIYVLIIGHSGDIEPFLYYLLSLHEEADRENQNFMTQKFFETGGALSPLEGISIQQSNNKIILTYPSADKKPNEIEINSLFN